MIKIVVAGNQQLVRAGIGRVLEQSNGIDVVAEVDDGSADIPGGTSTPA